MALHTEFDRALSSFLEGLTSKERDQFQIAQYKDVEKEIARIEQELRDSRMQRGLNRVKALVTGLQAFSGVLDTLVQIKADILAAIWGPIKFILKVTYTTTSAFDCILDTFKDIGECLPRTRIIELTFVQSPHLKLVLAWLYSDVLELFSEVLKLLRKRAWKQIFDILWRNLGGRLDDLRQRISSHRDLLDVETNTINIYEAQRFYAESRARFEKEDKRQALLILQECIDRLHTPYFNENLDALEDILDGSPADGSWLPNDTIFQNWASFDPESPSTLWITGIPGSGKTLLTYQAMTRILPQYSPSAVLIGLFLDSEDRFNETKLDPTASALRNILSRLLERDETTLIPIYRGLTSQVSKVLRPTRKQLQSWLDHLLEVTELTQIYVMLDGVDEVHQNKIEPLLRCLAALAQNHNHVKLLVSSRVVTAVKSIIGDNPTIYVHDHNSKDIEAYAQSRKNVVRSRFNFGTEEANDLASKILHKCNGMFLYCHLMFRTFERQLDLHSLWAAADSLPDGLDEIYRRIVQDILRLSETQRRTAARILEFLVSVRGKPRAREVQKTFNIQSKDQAFDISRELRWNLDELCGPLIEVRNGAVRFVHFTAKEFVQSPGSSVNNIQTMMAPINLPSNQYLLRDEPCLFPIQKSKAHTEMAIRVLRYLCFDCFDQCLSDDMLALYVESGDYLWIRYASGNWLSHVKQALTADQVEPALEACLNIFISKWLDDETVVEHLCIKAGLNMIDGIKIESKLLKKKLAYIVFQASQGNTLREGAVLGLASLSAFCRRVFRILDQIATRTSAKPARTSHLRDLYGIELFYCPENSCSNGFVGYPSLEMRNKHTMVHSRPYMCDRKDCHYSTIGFSSEPHLRNHLRTHEEISSVMESLKNLAPFEAANPVKKGDFIIGTEEWEYSMEVAVKSEDIESLSELLACNSKIHYFTDPKGVTTAVKLALKYDSIEIVKWIDSENGQAYLNGMNTSWNPLARAKSVEMVEFLINLGVDVFKETSVRDAELQSFLYKPKGVKMTGFASFFGSKKLPRDLINKILDWYPYRIQELLGFGLETLGDNRKSRSVLKVAAGAGNLSDLIQIAEERGLKMSPYVAQVLLDECEAKIPFDLLQYILDAGAKVHTDTYYQLAAAATAQDLPRMSFLLDRGVPSDEIFGVDGKIRTPLECAASSGFVEGIKLLLERGANITGPGTASELDINRRPVVQAARSKSKRAVDALQVLLEKGATPLYQTDVGDGILKWKYFIGSPNISLLEKRVGLSVKEFMSSNGTDIEIMLERAESQAMKKKNEEEERWKLEQLLGLV